MNRNYTYCCDVTIIIEIDETTTLLKGRETDCNISKGQGYWGEVPF